MTRSDGAVAVDVAVDPSHAATPGSSHAVRRGRAAPSSSAAPTPSTQVDLVLDGCDVETEQRIASVIEEQREAFRLRYPAAEYPFLHWDALRWDFTRADETRSEEEYAVTFAMPPGEAGPAMVPQFADVLRAFLVAQNFNSHNRGQHANAARHLWAAMIERMPADSFEWISVERDDIERAEARAAHNVTGQKLARLIDWLVSVGIVDAPGFVAKERRAAGPATDPARDGRLHRLPSRRAVTAVAELYHRRNEVRRDGTPVMDHLDRILVCATGLLMLTGLRAQELLTLPDDCLRQENFRGEPRWGLHFWKFKGHRKQRRRRELLVRWLSPLAAELAQELIAELHALTAQTRVRAQRIETALPTGRFPLWGDGFDFRERETLSLHETAMLLGYRDSRAVTAAISNGTFTLTTSYAAERVPRVLYPRHAVIDWLSVSQPSAISALPDAELISPRQIIAATGYTSGAVSAAAKSRAWPRAVPAPSDHNARVTVLTTDVEALLRQRQGSTAVLPAVGHATQHLSGTLLIIPFNAGHDGRAHSHCLVEHVRYAQLHHWLCGATGIASIFERMGLREMASVGAEDGAALAGAVGEAPPGPVVRLRPHAARHWLNTVASKAGMSAHQITIWMQRSNPTHTHSYLHKHSASDAAEFVREGVVNGQLVGAFVDRYRALDPAARVRLLEDVTAAHVLSGHRYCLQDFLRDGCPVNKVCGTCEHHAWDPTNPDTRASLTKLRANHELALVQLQRAEAAGMRVVGRQRALNEAAVAAYTQALLGGLSAPALEST